MEQFEDLTPIGQEKKNNMMWTPDMDKCLVEALVIQCHEGNKVDKGFKEVAYVAAAKALKQEFNIEISKVNVINRMKTIKKGYRDIEQMLSQSGFTFNYSTKKVECTDEVWDTYVKAHPKVKNLRHKRIEMIEELGMICGNDAATGEWCRGGPDINARRCTEERYQSQTDAVTEDTEHEDIGDTIINDNGGQNKEHENQVASSSRGSSLMRSTSKRGRRAKNIEAYVETMNTVALSIKQMAEAMERKSEFETKKAKFDERAAIDPSKLLETLQNIEELSKEDVANAFEGLLANDIKAKAFMAYPPDMRIDFLKRHYGVVTSGGNGGYTSSSGFEFFEM